MKCEREINEEVVSETLCGGPEIVADLTAEWQELCSAPGNYLPFCRPEWVAAYTQKQKKKRLLLLLVRISGKLRALLPLIPETESVSYLPVRILRGPSEFLLWPSDILVASESDRQLAVQELWRLIRERGGWDVVELPNIPEGGVAEDLLKIAESEGYHTYRWEYMHSPYIALPQHSEVKDPLQLARSSNLRKRLRNISNRMDKEGGVRVHHFDRADREILQCLYDLEASSWKGEKGSAILSKENEVVFWNTITFAAQESGSLSMHALEFRGHIVGVSLGFKYKNRFYGIKLGWDEQFRSYALGHMLVRESLADCCRDDISEFHMMGLRSDWKEQWSETTLAHSMCYIFRNGLYGSLMRKATMKDILWKKKTFEIRQEHIEA